jgi:HPt (histidine-containing phosphotransfer) domain-containing protein
MPMTLRADVSKARQACGEASPVDLAHLSSQTMGDPDLEQEVLSIFLSQAPTLIAAWKASKAADDRRRAAHTLKGAARAIGAWGLADIAAEAENPAWRDTAALEAACAQTCDYIRELLRD